MREVSHDFPENIIWKMKSVGYSSLLKVPVSPPFFIVFFFMTLSSRLFPLDECVSLEENTSHKIRASDY